jgi:hypothetical protein
MNKLAGQRQTVGRPICNDASYRGSGGVNPAAPIAAGHSFVYE